LLRTHLFIAPCPILCLSSASVQCLSHDLSRRLPTLSEIHRALRHRLIALHSSGLRRSLPLAVLALSRISFRRLGISSAPLSLFSGMLRACVKAIPLAIAC